ncbi:MAG TPA: GNAT family N-acetyltransferase [Chthoniobacterales bacterium]|nr:GNAT family N-acetyltransferase [Chthoniobacterales bacterium]
MPGTPNDHPVQIHFLAEHPILIEKLARLSWAEWQPIYRERGQTFEDAVKNYQERTNTDCLPLTLVALHGDELVGTVSLKYHDLDTRPNLDPWLGALLVLPDWRGRGIARMLMRRAEAIAGKLNLKRLYLWTHSAEGLYLKLGWAVVERTEYCGKQIVVMEKTVANATR